MGLTGVVGGDVKRKGVIGKEANIGTPAHRALRSAWKDEKPVDDFVPKMDSVDKDDPPGRHPNAEDQQLVKHKARMGTFKPRTEDDNATRND